MKFFSFLVRNAAPSVPSYSTSGFPSAPPGSYQQYARAYATNEIVYACIDLLADSASEPQICGRRYRRNSPMTRGEMRSQYNRLLFKGLSHAETNQRLIQNGYYESTPNHPLIRLLNDPNPLISRGQMWGTVVMDKKLAGNAYLLKSRFQAGPIQGAVAELWRLRPDRVKVIPLAGGKVQYEYTAGTEKVIFPQEDVLHFRERNPLDDYYGMPPLLVLMSRLSIDDYMRTFLRTFFEQGGAGPGAVLSVKQRLSQELKDEVRERFKRQFGRGGWHELLVLDQNEATYTQMGLNRGLRDAIPKELDAVNEARISMVFRIPGSILGLLIGYESSSYANKRQDWQVFWDLTMAPELSDLDDVLNLGLVPEFGGIDEVCFDLSDIKALQEDVDKVQDRHRKNVGAGIEFWEEGRDGMGLDPEAEGTLLVPSNMMPVRVRRGMIEMPEPEPRALPSPEEAANVIAEVRHICGKKIAIDVEGNPELYCWKCNVAFRPLDKIVALV